MPLGYPRRCGWAAILCLALGLPPALAQGEPAGKAWTDPPVRQASPSKPADASPTPATPVPATENPRRTAASKPERKPRATVAQAQPRPKVAERKAATHPLRIAGPPRRIERIGPDERFHRIEAAREAGFLVVRSRTVELPDGRRLHGYAPYDDENEDQD